MRSDRLPRLRRWRLWFAAATVAGVWAGCGGSPTAPSVSVTLPSEASIDGFVRSDGTAVTAGGGPGVGDLEQFVPGIGYREFYSFNLAGIPPTATLNSATLNLFQAAVYGAAYPTHGFVVVDHVDVGTALDPGDYAGNTLTPDLGILSINPAIGYKTIDVLAAVKADLAAGRSRSQFRLRFSVLDFNNDGQNDFAEFTDVEDSCCSVSRAPGLAIAYR